MSNTHAQNTLIVVTITFAKSTKLEKLISNTSQLSRKLQIFSQSRSMLLSTPVQSNYSISTRFQFLHLKFVPFTLLLFSATATPSSFLLKALEAQISILLQNKKKTSNHVKFYIFLGLKPSSLAHARFRSSVLSTNRQSSYRPSFIVISTSIHASTCFP